MEDLTSPDPLDISHPIPERAISNRSTADYTHVDGIDYAPTNAPLLTVRSASEANLVDHHARQRVGLSGGSFAHKTGPEANWMNDGAT